MAFSAVTLILLSSLVVFIAICTFYLHQQSSSDDNYLCGSDILVVDTRQLLLHSSDANLALRIFHNATSRDVTELSDFQQYVTCTTNKTTTDQTQCFELTWITRKNEITHCLDLKSSGFWFGGSEMLNQLWPINNMTFKEGPYIPSDIYSFPERFGGVQERYWLSSKGVAIVVPNHIPLWLFKTQEQFCLKAKRIGGPYKQYRKGPLLSYFLCISDSARTTHQLVMRSFFGLPTATPDERLFRQPIWSTWAQYKRYINHSVVLDFAAAILTNNFSASQVEIDDEWTPKYGDLEFDVKRFPQPRILVNKLHAMGHRVTVWVHPFVNNNSKTFAELASHPNVLVRTSDGAIGLSRWWRGDHAAAYDVTGPVGMGELLRRLSTLMQATGIDSFKFDAGEVNWLPDGFQLNNEALNPGCYAEHYALLALKTDPKRRLQEVRVGFQTQKLPIVVRMMDKDSRWGLDNGLHSVLTTALTFGILGYPFVLSDMIGGNGYCGGSESNDYTCYPSVELYIRWLQLATFLPIMQFSFPPWHYNSSVIALAQRFVRLHERLAQKYFIPLAKMACKEPAPIIRPLWWLDPKDDVAFSINDEFVIGDAVLVAPVMKEGSRQRDVYVPRGKWRQATSKKWTKGPTWLRHVPVHLEEILYFYSD